MRSRFFALFTLFTASRSSVSVPTGQLQACKPLKRSTCAVHARTVLALRPGEQRPEFRVSEVYSRSLHVTTANQLSYIALQACLASCGPTPQCSTTCTHYPISKEPTQSHSRTRGRHYNLRASLVPRETAPPPRPGSFRLGRATSNNAPITAPAAPSLAGAWPCEQASRPAGSSGCSMRQDRRDSAFWPPRRTPNRTRRSVQSPPAYCSQGSSRRDSRAQGTPQDYRPCAAGIARTSTCRHGPCTSGGSAVVRRAR